VTPGPGSSLKGSSQLVPDTEESGGRIVEMPVWYDLSVGPELERIAAGNGWTTQQVAEAHAGSEYQVFALGFVPGFAFMGLVQPSLAMPRLATPRAGRCPGEASRSRSARPRPIPSRHQAAGI